MPSSPHPDRLPRRTFVQMVGAAALTGAPRSVRGVPPRRGSLSLLPFLARPTGNSILIAARNGHAPASGTVEIRREGERDWRVAAVPIEASRGDFFRWTVEDLTPGTRYEYRVSLATPGDEPVPVVRERFTTQRRGETESYTAALMTDPHTGTFEEGTAPVQVLDDVIRNVRRDRPEFLIALGDNVAWSGARRIAQTSSDPAVRAYTMYRRHLAPVSISTPHFGVIGNWEGENGKFPDTAVETAAAVRRQFTPNPDHRTYPEGGSEREDYYAFT